uniref:Transposase n=1 Tax=Strongyloides stercoralis TaxID=6248 RepID=A0A0K0EC22_STRER
MWSNLRRHMDDFLKRRGPNRKKRGKPTKNLETPYEDISKKYGSKIIESGNINIEHETSICIKRIKK